MASVFDSNWIQLTSSIMTFESLVSVILLWQRTCPAILISKQVLLLTDVVERVLVMNPLKSLWCRETHTVLSDKQISVLTEETFH